LSRTRPSQAAFAKQQQQQRQHSSVAVAWQTAQVSFLLLLHIEQHRQLQQL
jgi:hypothetical protein